MSRYLYILIYLFGLGLSLQACNDSEFGGSSGGNGGEGKEDGGTPDDGVDDTGDDGEDGDDADGGDPPDDIDECTDGDKLKLFYPEKIQECIDDGKLFNFDKNVCTKMPEADFDCSFDGAIDDIKNRKSDSKLIDVLQKGEDKKGRMINCGEAKSGDVVVIQFWTPPDEGKQDCKYTAGSTSINSICFHSNYTGKFPTNEEEEADFVLDCMNSD